MECLDGSLFGTSRYTDPMEISKEQKQIISNSLTSTPATVLQRRIALVMSGLLALVVLLTLPYARQMFPHIPAFIAFYYALALFAHLITAYLLFGQFFRTRSPSLLVLATTYLYSSLIILPYVLSFPGLFSETGLLRAETQTTNWLWIFWHTGFPLGILFYVLLDKKYAARQATSHQIYIQSALVLFLLPLLIILLSIVAIESDSFLPVMIVNGDYTGLITSGVGPAIGVINVCAWIASISQARRGTVIHVWLSVAALASFLEVALVLWAGSRYSMGWYLARVNSIITATVVLCALLYQVNRLYEKIVDQVEELFSLKEANRVRDRFLSTMSHELRTPLTSIIGFSQMLLEDAAPGGWNQLQLNNLERILKNGQHLLSLINDVLDLSKIEAGQMAFPYSQVDVRELLTSVVEETQSMALAQHLVLRAEVEEGVVSLESNPLKLRQVLLNLVSNALKFTQQGEVTVSARRVISPEQIAMESIQEWRPCVITLDVMMPDLNGWQILHGLKDNPATASIPVIMLTVLSEPATGYVLGADDYLIKPFKPDALVSTLVRLVASRRRSSQASKCEARSV